MSFSDLSGQALAAFVEYGLIAFGIVMFVSAIGVPLPATLVLIAAGSFVEQGEFSIWAVLGLGILAVVLGDHVGYFAGRWGGQRLRQRLMRWFGGEKRLAKVEATTRRWGGVGVFLSRCLFTPLGPALNLTSGIAVYPLLLFFVYDVVGQAVWVGGYVELGRLFSDRVDAMSSLLSDITGISVAVLLVVGLGWLLIRSLRQAPATQPVVQAVIADDTEA